MIPITKIDLGPGAEANVVQVVRSGRLAQGPMVERLEAGFAEMAGVQHAIGLMSGTVALVAAIEGLGLGPGDEVITSPFTFVASVNAILESGASVRFVDIGSDYCIRPDLVAAAITPATKAIMPVHLYGLMADMDPIIEIAARHDLAVIEDAAQSHRAEYRGRRAGSFGVGCFSLYATKNITTGEGGVVTTDDDDVADRIRVLRNQGMRERYQYELVGHNWRMTELQAAIGLPQLDLLQERTERRADNAALLSERLGDLANVVLPVEPAGRTHVWHQYTIRLDGAPIMREELAARLGQAGIGTGIYYPRVVFDYDCYRSHPRVHVSPVPATEAAAANVLSLPVHPFLTVAEIDQIGAGVRDALADH